jgi:hypothetical protein
MLPLCGVPATLQQAMAPYRDLFCRDEGFAHVSRYITGLILSPTATFVFDIRAATPYAPPVYPAYHQEALYVTSLSDCRRRICSAHI